MQDIGECLKENMEAEKIEKHTENEMWFCSSCYRPLGKFLDTPKMGRMEIQGRNGEIYEVGFNYITVFCPKCGKENYIQSDLEVSCPRCGEVAFNDSLDIPLERNFFELSQLKRKILLKKLSTRQKAEYKLLLDNIKWINSEKGNIPRELVKEISEKEKLPVKKIVENLNIIINEIKVLKG